MIIYCEFDNASYMYVTQYVAGPLSLRDKENFCQWRVRSLENINPFNLAIVSVKEIQ